MGGGGYNHSLGFPGATLGGEGAGTKGTRSLEIEHDAGLGREVRVVPELLHVAVLVRRVLQQGLLEGLAFSPRPELSAGKRQEIYIYILYICSEYTTLEYNYVAVKSSCPCSLHMFWMPLGLFHSILVFQKTSQGLFYR